MCGKAMGKHGLTRPKYGLVMWQTCTNNGSTIPIPIDHTKHPKQVDINEDMVYYWVSMSFRHYHHHIIHKFPKRQNKRGKVPAIPAWA